MDWSERTSELSTKGSSGARGGDSASRSLGRRRRYCRCVGHDLLTSLGDGAAPPAWREFLALSGGLDAVHAHLAAASPGSNPLPEISDLVSETDETTDAGFFSEEELPEGFMQYAEAFDDLDRFSGPVILK